MFSYLYCRTERAPTGGGGERRLSHELMTMVLDNNAETIVQIQRKKKSDGVSLSQL